MTSTAEDSNMEFVKLSRKVNTVEQLFYYYF